MSRCPKCHYQRVSDDGHVHPGICPGCGIAIGKWLQRNTTDGQAIACDEVPITSCAPPLISADAVRELLLALPQRTDTMSLYARGVLWLALLLWGGWFAVHGIDWPVIGGSFMHQINLPFHEFGHVLFMPLGHFLTILGGSLFQLLLPLGLALVFVFRQRDNFAASVCLWWCGQSFVDLSPYIADAPLRLLPLIGGMDESAHDWGNMLSMLGLTHWASGLAHFSFALGCITMLLALCWGWLLLRKQHAETAGG